MQTFLPYPDFTMSARVLDRQRLGKQRVEALQILRTLRTGPYICSECRESFPDDPCCGGMGKPIKTPWYNHPAVQMWKTYEWTLYTYLEAVCREWTKWGYEDTCYGKASILMSRHFADTPANVIPPWLGRVPFHVSHQSNLLRKDPEYYGKYFAGIPADLPYIWPTKTNL